MNCTKSVRNQAREVTLVTPIGIPTYDSDGLFVHPNFGDQGVDSVSDCLVHFSFVGHGSTRSVE